jgi:predicted Zn-dependent peptidase
MGLSMMGKAFGMVARISKRSRAVSLSALLHVVFFLGSFIAIDVAAKPDAQPKMPSGSPRLSRITDPLLAKLNIPYQSFRLPNGFTVIVHEDHKAPTIDVSMWYGVGSANESEGKTGLAHLFEHLMFNGSQHYNDDWFQVLNKIGWNVNGSTGPDYTNYYQTVPKGALDRVLWMESDRMIYLLSVLDQARLDEQRKVVKNEKRQRAGVPLGMLWDTMSVGLFPLGHPYHYPVIGRMQDLDAASLDDVKDWFTAKYGATNALLVLSGDITLAEAKEKVTRYFGSARVGEPVVKVQQDVPLKLSNSFARMKDDVAQVSIHRAWVGPAFEQQDNDALAVAAAALNGNRNSWLYKVLVEDKQLATSVSVSLQTLQLASVFSIDIDVKKGVSETAVLAELDRLIAEFLKTGPTVVELQRVYIRQNMSYAEALESAHSKAQTLAQSFLYTGNPNQWKEGLVRRNAVTPAQARTVARQWLSHGYHQVVVEPFGRYVASADSLDRAAGLPAIAVTPAITWPTIAQTKLSNGIPVMFVQRKGAPTVKIDLSFTGGKAGAVAMGKGQALLATLALQGIQDGAAGRSAREIEGMLDDLGATFVADVNADSSHVFFSALTTKLPKTVALAASLIRSPDFPAPEFERSKVKALAYLAARRESAEGKGYFVLAPTLFGPNHPYGTVPTAAAIQTLKREDLSAYMAQWIRPDNAAIFVVGDTTLAEIKPLLENALGTWTKPGKPQKIDYPAIPAVTAARVILINQRGATQSQIYAALPGPKGLAPNEEALSAMNLMMGGMFTSRLNMNLREAKGWSYGVRSAISTDLDQRLFQIVTAVQTDKTAEALSAAMKELKDAISAKPFTQAELDAARANAVLTLPQLYEDSAEILFSMESNYLRGRPLDYPASIKTRWDALTLAQVESAAKQLIDPAKTTWVVVGDLEKIEEPIRALKQGMVTVTSLEQQ